MNRDGLYEADDDDDVEDEEDEEDDGIGEDLEDIRRACMVPESNSDENTAGNGGLGECVGGEENQTGSVGVEEGDDGGIPSDSDNEDDMEMLRSIKDRLALSTDVCDGSPRGLGIPLDSESEDDFEMLRSIKSRLALSMDEFRPSMGLSDEDEDDDDAFETLRAIRRRFSAYENFDPGGNFTDDSPEKKKQIRGNGLPQCQIQRKHKLAILLIYMKTLPLCLLVSWRHVSHLLCQLRVQVSLNLPKPLWKQFGETGLIRNFFEEK